jgi:hypothetical protein
MEMGPPRARRRRPALGTPVVAVDSGTPTLADQGISLNESAACQRLAAVPEERFEEVVEEETQGGQEARPVAAVPRPA